MTNQEFADVLVMGMYDNAVINLIHYHIEAAHNGWDEHKAVYEALIVALDNMYGTGSYQTYINSGVLPSQQ